MKIRRRGRILSIYWVAAVPDRNIWYTKMTKDQFSHSGGIRQLAETKNLLPQTYWNYNMLLV